MREDASYEEFQYQYELLRTRLEIRQYFLNTVVKEVYENIGQVLSYVRMQLALAKNDPQAAWNDMIEPGYQLIGKTIGDLRNMCKLFNPEQNIIKKQGFPEVIRLEVKTQYPLAVFQPEEPVPDMPVLPDEKMLLVFGTILELLGLLKEEKKPLQLFSISLSTNTLQFILQYAGSAVQESANKLRIAVLGGVLQNESVNGETGRLILTIPFK